MIAAAPWLAALGKRLLKVTGIDVAAADLDKLRALKGKRCLLTPSHSGGHEPFILADVCRRVGEHCNYLAALELFERSPAHGWLLQRAGAYSIIRGTADRASFSTTKELLVAAKRWLVIFPEGETVWQNDTVMPFRQGVIQLAFHAREEASKAAGAAPLFCVPIAIKYVYPDDMSAVIEASLVRLEAKLLPASSLGPAPPYDRLRRVGEAVLAANEKKYGVEHDGRATLDDRIQRMKELAVAVIERRLEVEPRPGQELLDRVRALFNAVDRIVFDDEAESPYERTLLAERQRETAVFYAQLWRVLQLVAIYDGYVRETMTVERFLDVLGLLETEVFGERPTWGPRRARVAVGEPLDLGDYATAYQTDRRATAEEVTLTLEGSVRRMLEALGTGCRTVAARRG